MITARSTTEVPIVGVNVPFRGKITNKVQKSLIEQPQYSLVTKVAKIWLNDSTAAFLAFISCQLVSNFHGSSPQWFLAHTPVASGGLGLHDYAAHAIVSFVVPLACSIRYATQGFMAYRSETILPAPPPPTWLVGFSNGRHLLTHFLLPSALLVHLCWPRNIIGMLRMLSLTWF